MAACTELELAGAALPAAGPQPGSCPVNRVFPDGHICMEPERFCPGKPAPTAVPAALDRSVNHTWQSLVIVESPAKAKTIGKYLGEDYKVTASMGHIRDLPASSAGHRRGARLQPRSYITIKGKEKLVK